MCCICGMASIPLDIRMCYVHTHKLALINYRTLYNTMSCSFLFVGHTYLSRAPQAGPAGFCMTHTIPTLRRGGKRQEELLMTSVSWLTPPSTAHHSHQSELQTLPAPLLSPGINTCRPMSFQEDGAKVQQL